MDEIEAEDRAKQPVPVVRSLALAAAVGAAIGLSVIGVVYAIIAIPLYALAQSDPHGLDRPFFRHALVRIALPAGLVVGVLLGALVGVWYARGGHLPTDRNPNE
ncbi:MAG: hypothetical protein ACR2LQ_06990 [Acidimicrobiales bacterium]